MAYSGQKTKALDPKGNQERDVINQIVPTGIGGEAVGVPRS